MGDRATVVLAVVTCLGAWAARSLLLLAVFVLAIVALAKRRPVVVMVAAALAASALGTRAWEGLRPPALGPWSGVVTLVGDPADVAGALRVDVRIGGKRVERKLAIRRRNRCATACRASGCSCGASCNRCRPTPASGWPAGTSPPA